MGQPFLIPWSMLLPNHRLYPSPPINIPFPIILVPPSHRPLPPLLERFLSNLITIILRLLPNNNHNNHNHPIRTRLWIMVLLPLPTRRPCMIGKDNFNNNNCNNSGEENVESIIPAAWWSCWHFCILFSCRGNGTIGPCSRIIRDRRPPPILYP